MRKADIYISILLIVLSIGIFIGTLGFPKVVDKLGPEFMPRVIAGMFFFLSLFLLMRSIFSSDQDKVSEKVLWKRLAGNLGMLIAFVISIKLIGFTISMFWFLLLYLKIFGKTNWWRTIIITLVTIPLLYSLLILLLKIPLPEPFF